jgi:hypothetical protein
MSSSAQIYYARRVVEWGRKSSVCPRPLQILHRFYHLEAQDQDYERKRRHNDMQQGPGQAAFSFSRGSTEFKKYKKLLLFHPINYWWIHENTEFIK